MNGKHLIGPNDMFCPLARASCHGIQGCAPAVFWQRLSEEDDLANIEEETFCPIVQCISILMMAVPAHAAVNIKPAIVDEMNGIQFVADGEGAQEPISADMAKEDLLIRVGADQRKELPKTNGE
jgi:hypothetical protein